MGFTTDRQVSGELLSSSVCNSACTYCFIPKVPSLKEFLPRIRKKLGGEHIKDLKRLFGENLEALSLWGTEPMTTLPEWNEEVPKIIDAFPKLGKIFFSTNLFMDSQIIVDFIEHLPKGKEDLTLNIQISIDGPPEITDKNRGQGGTKKITEHFITLLQKLNDVDLGKLKVEFVFKSTIDMSNVEWFLESPSRLYGYFFFFDMLIDQAAITSKNKNVILRLCGLPTISAPGFYTVEDGKKLLEFFMILKDVERINNSRKIFLHLPGSLNHYIDGFERMLRYGSEYHEKQTIFTCSGGDSNFQLDCDDMVHICHRTLFYQSKEFVDSLVWHEYGDNRAKSASRGMIKNAQKNWIIKNDGNQGEINRFLYITGNYHHFGQPKVDLNLSTIYELASSGQILPKYLDKTEASWFAIFINNVISCPAENILSNGTIHLPPISQLRLYGNGAFDFIFKDAIKETRNEYIK